MRCSVGYFVARAVATIKTFRDVLACADSVCIVGTISARACSLRILRTVVSRAVACEVAAPAILASLLRGAVLELAAPAPLAVLAAVVVLILPQLAVYTALLRFLILWFQLSFPAILS